MDRQKKFLVITLLMAILATTSAKEFYVAPNGSPNGDGSIDNPWDLRTALNHPPQVQPGDIIWVRGGEYEGPFSCKLKGTEDKPIIVRTYPGEKVILQVYTEHPTYPRSKTQAILNIDKCSYVWFWGFEIRNYGIKTRWTDITGSNPGSGVMDGIYVISPNNKIINCVVHNVMGNGMGVWRPSQTTEVYGNLVFNNGWIAPDRGHGHCFYTQNEVGTKYFIDNIAVMPFADTLAQYGSSRAFLKNYYYEGNVFAFGWALVGGLTSAPVENITFKGNYFWATGPTLGYYGTNFTKDLVFEENYVVTVGRTERLHLRHWQYLRFRKNKLFNLTGDPVRRIEGCNRQIDMIIGPLGIQNYDIDENEYCFTPLWRFPRGGFTITNYPGYQEEISVPWDHFANNIRPTWRPSNSPGGSLGFDANGVLYGTRPTRTEIFIRPNRYQMGRVHIIIFNWNRLPTVEVDISSILPIGTPYEIRNAFNYFNDIVSSGIYDGKPIILDMVNRTIATPVGWNQPLASSPYPEFGVFILLPEFPSVPQVVLATNGERFFEIPTFRLKAYDEFPVRFIIEITKDKETRTFVTDYTASGAETTYTIPETLPPGAYIVKVKAQNKYGRESPYTGPMTIIIKSPPSPPTLIEPKNGSVVVPTPTFRVKATDPERKQVKFIIEVKRNEEVKIFETGMVNNEEEATFTVPPEQTLAEGTYTWRVKVKDEEGFESEWSDVWNFTVNNPPSTPTLISPKENAVVSSTPTFKVKADDPTGQRVRIRVEVLDKEGNILLQLTTSEVDSGQEVNVSLPPDKALAPGTYYWRAVASDRWMESAYSETRRFHVPAMSRRISKGLSFISIPLRTEQRWVDLLELPEDQLRVVTWDPFKNRYVYASVARAPNGSAVDEIAARPHLGQGYWIKLDTDKEVRFVGHSVDKEVVIDLQPGWNIIGYPFTKPTYWNPDSIKIRRLGEVKSLRGAWMAGWLEGYLWGWKPNSRNSDTGSYFLVYEENILPESVSVMEPFNAYWIRAYVECQLILEPPNGEGLTKSPRQRNSVSNGFGICINAKLNELESRAFVGVGTVRRLQAIEPPTPPTGKMLQIVVSDVERELVADVRDKISQRMIWELTVRWMPTRGQQSEISLSFDGIASIPKGYSVFLVDKMTGERRYLRTTPVYRFTPQDGEAERRFALLVEQNGNRVLRILNLKAQPVRGQGVVVKFRLTKAAQTTTEILTLTGRTAAILEAGQPRHAGEHLLFWRGINNYKQPVGAGAYLVRVHAIDEEGRQTQSFTIVRLR